MNVELLAAISAAISSEFPDIPVFSNEDKVVEQLQGIGIFLDAVTGDSMESMSTGQLRGTTKVTARVIVAVDFENANSVAQDYAMQIMKIVNLNNFGLDVGCAIVGDVGKGVFSPELECFVCWMVSWTHEIIIGKSAFEDDGNN